MPTAIWSGNTSGATNAGVKDTFISSFEPAVPKGSEPILAMSVADIVALIAITDLLGTGGLPAGATVTGVQIELNYEADGSFVDNTVVVEARRILVAWDEATGTWTNRTTDPTDVAWGGAGATGAGDVAASASSGFTFPGAGVDEQWYVIPSSAGLIADVQAALDDSSSTVGWKLTCNGYPNWVSSEGVDGRRWIVRVAYTEAATNPWNLSGTGPRADGSMASGPMASGPLGFSTRGIFVPSAGLAKVWDGSAWQARPVKHWTGSAWVQKPAKHWNGAAWQ